MTGKGKNLDFSMILIMYLNMISAELGGKKALWFLDKLCLLWPKCVVGCSAADESWIEVFEPSKKAQNLNYSKIFNYIHDFQVYLSLVVI